MTFTLRDVVHGSSPTFQEPPTAINRSTVARPRAAAGGQCILPPSDRLAPPPSSFITRTLAILVLWPPHLHPPSSAQTRACEVGGEADDLLPYLVASGSRWVEHGRGTSQLVGSTVEQVPHDLKRRRDSCPETTIHHLTQCLHRAELAHPSPAPRLQRLDVTTAFHLPHDRPPEIASRRSCHSPELPRAARAGSVRAPRA